MSIDPKSKRPVHLNLLAIRLPVTAIVSILHRISGIVIFLSLPFALYLLQMSLVSKASFVGLQQWLSSGYMRLITYFLLLAVIYHVLAGVRHLIMDLGVAESEGVPKLTAVALILLFLGLALFLGVRLLW